MFGYLPHQHLALVASQNFRFYRLTKIALENVAKLCILVVTVSLVLALTLYYSLPK